MEKGNLILNTKKFNIQYLCEYLQQLLFIKNYKNCDFEDKKKKKNWYEFINYYFEMPLRKIRIRYISKLIWMVYVPVQ